jgi:hypothetical protein
MEELFRLPAGVRRDCVVSASADDGENIAIPRDSLHPHPPPLLTRVSPRLGYILASTVLFPPSTVNYCTWHAPHQLPSWSDLIP